MDAELDGKLFDQVFPQRPSPSDYCRSMRAALGLPEITDNYQAFYNADGIYYHWWMPEEKAAFCQTWTPVMEAYAASHPYFTGEGEPYWEYTHELALSQTIRQTYGNSQELLPSRWEGEMVSQ